MHGVSDAGFSRLVMGPVKAVLKEGMQISYESRKEGV